MTFTVDVLPSLYVKPDELLNVGALFAAVVRTVAVLLDVLPIVVVPLFVVKTNVAVKDFEDVKAFRSAVRCAEVSFSVEFALPGLCAASAIARTDVEAFLISSVYVKAEEYIVLLNVIVGVASSAVTVDTLFRIALPSVFIVDPLDVP